MTISCKAWNSPAEYPSWVARCDIKGSVSKVLNPIFSKQVQGQKHPGRWGIVEHQIPSIKMFKTNTKSHKHPSIRFLSKSKTQLVNQRKQKVAFSPGTAHSPIERDGVQLRQYWMTLPLSDGGHYDRKGHHKLKVLGMLIAWRCHSMEKMLAFCVGNSLVAGALPSQRDSDAELFICVAILIKQR